MKRKTCGKERVIFEDLLKANNFDLTDEGVKSKLRKNLLRAKYIISQWKGRTCWICNHWTTNDFKDLLYMLRQTCIQYGLGELTSSEVVDFLEEQLIVSLKIPSIILVGKLIHIENNEWCKIGEDVLKKHTDPKNSQQLKTHINLLYKQVGLKKKVETGQEKIGAVINTNLEKTEKKYVPSTMLFKEAAK